MLNVSETWPLTRSYLQRLRRNDRAMIRQICNVKPDDVATVKSKYLLAQLEIDYIVVNLKEKRLRWFVHVDQISGAFKFVNADRSRAWPREAKDGMDDTNR